MPDVFQGLKNAKLKMLTKSKYNCLVKKCGPIKQTYLYQTPKTRISKINTFFLIITFEAKFSFTLHI